MEWQVGLSIGLLVYAAFVFDILGFLARDELKLRLLMLCAGILYMFYYYFVADAPLWDAILTNGVLDLVNFTVICIVILERSTFTMSSSSVAIYRHFSMMSPGQFRKLLAAGQVRTTTSDETLSVEGKTLPRLFYLLDGDVWIEKGDASAEIGPLVFIGEIAFLHDTPATATVRIGPGARYVEWTHDALDALFRKHPAIRTALLAHLNFDMSRKLAASAPGDLRSVSIAAS